VLATDQLTIGGLVLFGDVRVIVPPGTDVQLGGVVLFGDQEYDDDDHEPMDAMPTVKVRPIVLFGDIDVEARASKVSKKRKSR
jgi:hypothetical protein